MAWKYKGRQIKVGKNWTDDNGYKHPYNWEVSWSIEEKKQWGLIWEEEVD